MDKQTASRSAAIIAAHRAFESSKTAEERICYDPLARRFLPKGFTVIGEVEMDEETALKAFKEIVPGFHEYFLARTRYIDEQLQKSLRDGLQQLVILGAGYDSRAYRFDEMVKTVQVFEVDHPLTQSTKIEKLQEIFRDLPNHVTFVPVDFQKENLETALSQCGYDSGLKTLFIWEGVTMYIESESVDNTLLFISQTSGKGSSVIFDYTYQNVIDGTNDRKEAKGWFSIAQKSSEPLRFGIPNNSVDEFLRKRGFTPVAIATSDYFNENYFTGVHKKREATPVLSIVHAEAMD